MSTALLALAGGNLGANGLALGLAGQEAAAEAAPLAMKPDHPDQYTVKRGDTLWGISAMFLRDPWYWPEIWTANPQVENPHLIYPGDVLNLVYVNGQPRLQLARGTGGTVERGGVERLSPQIREQSLEAAIPTIPLESIAAFLGKHSVLEKDQINDAPYVVAIRDQRLIGAAGNDIYVRGDVGEVNTGYNVVNIGKKLVDPDDGDVVGYEAHFVGTGSIRRGGDPATLFLTDSAREAAEGDRLVPQESPYPAYFTPRPPAKPIDGRIISVVDGVSQVGQFQVVVINRGQRDGLEAGNVLRIWQAGAWATDHDKSGRVSRKVRLPDEQAGLSMVFRSYDRISYALVLEATSEIHVEDKVRSPG
jgi:hypothetical protein